jgi:hypothetical protein
MCCSTIFNRRCVVLCDIVSSQCPVLSAIPSPQRATTWAIQCQFPIWYPQFSCVPMQPHSLTCSYCHWKPCWPRKPCPSEIITLTLLDPKRSSFFYIWKPNLKERTQTPRHTFRSVRVLFTFYAVSSRSQEISLMFVMKKRPRSQDRMKVNS